MNAYQDFGTNPAEFCVDVCNGEIGEYVGTGERADVEALRVSYTCGPSDAEGIAYIANLSVSGGATRETVLAMLRQSCVLDELAHALWEGFTALERDDARSVCRLRER